MRDRLYHVILVVASGEAELEDLASAFQEDDCDAIA